MMSSRMRRVARLEARGPGVPPTEWSDDQLAAVLAPGRKAEAFSDAELLVIAAMEDIDAPAPGGEDSEETG